MANSKASKKDSSSSRFLTDGVPYGAIYDLVLGDEDARGCKDISEDACREQPKSFGIHVVALTLSKAGDGLADAKLTLAWLLSSLGAPAMLIPWIVPIREALSLLPQLVIAKKIREFEKRKMFWIIGSLVQGLCIAMMGVAGLFLRGDEAGYAVIFMLVIFSLARGVCSISLKDVMGKTVAKQRRGRLNGLSASVAGFVTLIFGGMLLFDLVPTNDTRLLIGLMVLAGAAWILAAVVYSGLPEYSGATEGGKSGFAEALSSLNLLVKDSVFRHFIIARSLFISTALVAPFYVMLANQQTESDLSTLGLLLVLAGLANLVSGPFWGRYADLSSKGVLIVSGLMCGSLAVLVTIASVFDWSVTHHSAWYGCIIFILYIGHAGVRLGRKIYLMDMANQENRAKLVAVSNTLIGFLLLFIGGLSTLLAKPGAIVAIMTFGALSFAAAGYAARLKNVSA